MKVDEDGFCFVCGPRNESGLMARFETDAEKRSAVCRLVVPARFQGWRQMVHGGIVATLLDEACIYACRAGGGNFVTGEIRVRYRQPVPVDTPLTVRAEVVGGRRRLLEARALLEIAGEVHAEAETKVFAVL